MSNGFNLDSITSFGGGVYDDFTKMVNGYLGMRTAEAQADASGSGQAALNGAVETTQSVGKTPISTDQYQAVGGSVGGDNLQIAGLSLSPVHLAVGAAVAYLLLKR